MDIPKQTFNRATISATGNTIMLEGDIDQNDPEEFIVPFFKKAASIHYDSYIIDITNLEYINSTGVKCLIEFLKSLIPLSKVIFRTDQKKPWQQKSMGAIQAIDKDHISLIDASQ
ncbi:MAG: hypothetical protein JW881_10770 [Spirochaetales bacterium]|nr:hypothetical protein [Spirochaetales bacterium]